MQIQTSVLEHAPTFAQLFGKHAKELHQGQQELAELVFRPDIHEVTAAFGRRGGKTSVVGENIVPRFALLYPESETWLFSLTQDQANILFGYLESVVMNSRLELLVDDIKKAPWPELTWRNGSKVRARGLGHDGKYARGHGADLVIVDEAAFVADPIVNEVISPMQAASQIAKRINISTPNGHNHFYRAYLDGKAGKPGMASLHMPSWRNPFLSREYLHAEKLKRTALAWSVEYGAEFHESHNAKFPWSVIESCIDYEAALSQPPKDGAQYFFGYDPANERDRSGYVVIDASSLPWRVVDIRDLAGRGYLPQVREVSELASIYNNARGLMDTTSHDTVAELLRQQSVRVEPLVFSYQSKKELIDGLALLMEQGNLRIPHHQALISELQFYREEVTSTGRVKLGAPDEEGAYDDLVTALALAVRAAGSRRRPVIDAGEDNALPHIPEPPDPIESPEDLMEALLGGDITRLYQ